LRDREQENHQKLEAARQKLETAIESIDDGFAVFDKDQRLTMSNERYKLLYPSVAKLGYHGFTKEELVREIFKSGLLFEERRHADPRADTEDEVENKVRQIMALLESGEPVLIRLRDGRWIEVTSNATPDGGCVCVHKDVTDRKEDEDRLTHMALHDSLTGLYNRAAFEAQLHEQFDKCKEQGQEFGLMFLDLDGFKGINDTMGHDVGDQVLIHVAHMLKKSIRVEDLVARLGGDEFAVIISEPVDRESMSHIADRVLTAVGSHYEHQGVKAPFGVSIGIASYPSDGDTIDILLANSDAAMYAAKKSGKGHYRFYSDVKNNDPEDASTVSFPVSI
jgi:diguanylate cyclase (GGDEF)-like protein